MGNPILGLAEHVGVGGSSPVEGQALDARHGFVRMTKPDSDETPRGTLKSRGRREEANCMLMQGCGTLRVELCAGLYGRHLAQGLLRDAEGASAHCSYWAGPC